MVAPEQLSVTEGAVHDATAPQIPALAFTEILEGHEVITGAWASTTVTVKEHVAVLPAGSVAV